MEKIARWPADKAVPNLAPTTINMLRTVTARPQPKRGSEPSWYRDRNASMVNLQPEDGASLWVHACAAGVEMWDNNERYPNRSDKFA